MNTDNFISAFIQEEQRIHEEQESLLEKAVGFVHQNSTAVKTAEAFAIVACVAFVVYKAYSMLASRTISLCSALSVLGGVILAVIYSIAYSLLEIVIPHAHDMSSHTFQPAEFGAAKLYYQSHVPILEINYDDVHQAGYSHGYLMGKYISTLLSQLSFINWATGMPKAEDLPRVLQAVRDTLPKDYLEEIKGMVEGFNTWAQEQTGLFSSPKKVTVEDLLLFHLMPDSCHFTPKRAEERMEASQPHVEPSSVPLHARASPACTVVVDRDEEKGMTFGRTMDWPSFGVFGKYSLMINRKYSRGKGENKKLSTVEIGFPGFAGTLTGMNRKGVTLAMNVCSGNTRFVEGMPAAFYNRACLESSKSLEEVEEKVEKEAPLGSYHLSCADKNRARSFHIKQGYKRELVKREGTLDAPLIVTNCNYAKDGSQFSPMHESGKREKIIQKLFSKAKQEVKSEKVKIAKLVEKSLSLPYVNNVITTHKMVAFPKTKEIQVAFDEGFAGGRSLHALDTRSLFSGG